MIYSLFKVMYNMGKIVKDSKYIGNKKMNKKTELNTAFVKTNIKG